MDGFVPALQPQQGLWITYRRRCVRSAQDTEGWHQCRGHPDQMKDQTAAASRGQNLLSIIFVLQERHGETR